MRFFSLVLAVFVAFLATISSVASFNVPPTGMCFADAGGDCYRCDCAKPLKCYKGSCR